jgi:beta-lactamase regulating signal transducer with metallopeptidase domain
MIARRAKLFGVSAPRLALSENAASPLLLGVFRPLILLPRNFTALYNRDEMKMVLDHELAHVVRRDLLWLWLPTLARCIFFFHPVLWLVERGWVRSQEMASDELALAKSQATPAGYAQALLKGAEQQSPSAPGFLFAVNSSATFKICMHGSPFFFPTVRHPS